MRRARVLPFRRAASGGSADGASAGGRPRRRALVADDEKLMREFAAETLRRSGFLVDVVNDGEAAAERLCDAGASGAAAGGAPRAGAPGRASEAADAPAYDLALLDIRMPGRDGLDLLADIRKSGADTVVVLMTAYATVDAAVAALRLGARDFVTKPFSADELDLVVARALETGRLAAENRRLRRDARHSGGLDLILGESRPVRDLKETIRSLAPSRATVLLTGESGTGKELFARALHVHSPRADRPFIQLNCAALPEGLLESELFGYERGAFTGAEARQIGKFEMADGGTLLLDEISEIGAGLQPKLLRVLQEREFYRVGGREPVRVDVRVVATTNVDLLAAVEAGRFRRDLFYRLNVVPLKVPPLSERREDILTLARHFLVRAAAENGAPAQGISPEAAACLEAHSWPGNVRELQNVIERAVVLGRGPLLEPADLRIEPGPGSVAGGPALPADLESAERRLILDALRAEGDNRTRAARRLGISLRTLRYKLRRYGVPAGTPGVKKAA